MRIGASVGVAHGDGREAAEDLLRDADIAMYADVFVPIAEETGAIMEIGRVVLRQACRAVQHWRATVPGQRHLLKIDRTILEFDATRRGSLVAAIAELGRTLGLTVVVEGVETPEHLAWARQASCDAAQGYHFSPPLPAADVPQFLRRSGRDVGQGGVEDGQPVVDLGVGGGQRWGDAEGPAHPG